jgi:hypothetical protein
MTKSSLHRTFVLWPLRLIVVSFVMILVTAWLAPVSKLFIGAAVVLGVLHSLSTMEELTGGRELIWLSIPLVLAGDVLLSSWSFAETTFIQSSIVFVQFLAVIVMTESLIVFLLRSRLEAFCARRGPIDSAGMSNKRLQRTRR